MNDNEFNNILNDIQKCRRNESTLVSVDLPHTFINGVEYDDKFRKMPENELGRFRYIQLGRISKQPIFIMYLYGNETKYDICEKILFGKYEFSLIKTFL